MLYQPRPEPTTRYTPTEADALGDVLVSAGMAEDEAAYQVSVWSQTTPFEYAVELAMKTWFESREGNRRIRGARKRSGVAPNDADDADNEALRKLLLGFHTYVPNGDFGGWAYTVALRAMVDAAAAARRGFVMPVPDAAPLRRSRLDVAAPDTGDEVASTLVVEDLKAIASADSRVSTVLDLIDRGLNLTEIAQQLGIARSTLVGTLRRFGGHHRRRIEEISHEGE